MRGEEVRISNFAFSPRVSKSFKKCLVHVQRNAYFMFKMGWCGSADVRINYYDIKNFEANNSTDVSQPPSFNIYLFSDVISEVNSHDGFLMAELGKVKECCQMSQMGCPIYLA